MANTAGDQPEDVEDQIRNMCFEFITNPNAVILAVTAANQDLVNSDGLKMARTVDPDGDRTIGVLTKVDIMDSGTDCTDILNNKVIPLKKGYIAVVNRSQKDIQDGLPIRSGLKKETEYFQSHPKYRSYLSKCGTTNLTRTLNSILMHHIRDTLPDLKSKVMKLLSEEISKLAALGDSDGESASMLGGTLLRIISKFAINVNTSIDGRGHLSASMTAEGACNTIEMSELYGGARVSYIFNELFGKMLWHMDPFEGLDDDEIRTAIANANGTRPSLFVPEISFDLLVKKQIARLEAPGIQCVDMILDEMLRLAYQCELPEMLRFPLLRDRMYEIVSEMLKSCMKPTQQMIVNMIHVELAYINTSHPDFIGGKQALALVTKKSQQQSQQQQIQQQHQQSMETYNETSVTTTTTTTTSAVSGKDSSTSTAPLVVGTPVTNGIKPNPGLQTPEPRNNNPFIDKQNPATATTPATAQSGGYPVGNAFTPPNGGFFGLFRPPATAAFGQQSSSHHHQSSSTSGDNASNQQQQRSNSPSYPQGGHITTRHKPNTPLPSSSSTTAYDSSTPNRPPKPTKSYHTADEYNEFYEGSNTNNGLVKLPQVSDFDS